MSNDTKRAEYWRDLARGLATMTAGGAIVSAALWVALHIA